MIAMTPQYNTLLFTEVYDNVEDFLNDYKNIGLPTTISDTSATTLFWLLYGRYGNNPIANRDINQWKVKVFSVIFQYGPTWEKKLQIQTRLRSLTEEEIIRGNKVVQNNALNPDTAPGTAALDELLYINNQTATNSKRSFLEGYAALATLLEDDVSEAFLSHFKPLFSMLVRPEHPILYYEEDDN